MLTGFINESERESTSEFVRLSPGDAQSGLSPSEILDDVPALVDLQHRFEFCVHDDVDGLLERCSEMHLDAQVALLYQMEARPITRVRGQVETKEGVPITEVVTTQTVPFVL